MAREAEEATEVAIAKAEEAIPKALLKKVLSSWEFVAIATLIFLGSVFAAIAISLGLSLGIMP